MGKRSLIVVHAGRRDDYQVALAIHEVNRLKFLVTDFYSPLDSIFGRLFFKSGLLGSIFSKRYKEGLPSYKVVISYRALWYFMLFQLTKNIKYDNLKGIALGNKANRLSKKHSLPVLSMNTYATEAFKDNPNGPNILFQFHPHPVYVKNILQEEMDKNPKSVASLSQEYEFSISEIEIDKLSNEVLLATDFICASTVTKNSLVLEGVEEAKIAVIPYGVDTVRFPYLARNRMATDQFNILFIGSLNQRKGITYLLDALTPLKNIKLFVVGRGIFDPQLLNGYPFEIEVLQNVSHEKLVAIMHQSHCFVLPSIIEGFGQVILEAMSTGLPVIASENTAGADIIENGKNGFVVPVRDSIKITQIIHKLAENNDCALKLGQEANKTALQYTWSRFRTDLVKKVLKIVE